MPINFNTILDDLITSGLSITDHVLPETVIATLAKEALELQQAGAFRLAQVGTGIHQELHHEIRNDRIHWLDPNRLSETQQHYFACIESLRIAINRTLFLGLFEFEGFMAIYPQGSFYQRHMDQFAGMPHRVITVILYLNEQWQPSDGGMLRIYHKDAEGNEIHQDVAPLGGRLVLFLSGQYPHEVLPATRNRLSLTGWLRIRPIAEESTQLFLAPSS